MIRFGIPANLNIIYKGIKINHRSSFWHKICSSLNTMKQIFFIFSLLFIFFVSPSFAEIYKWIDEKGIVHYTDDIMQVPEKDRPMAEEMGLQDGKGERKIEGDSTLRKKEDVYKDRLGRGRSIGGVR